MSHTPNTVKSQDDLNPCNNGKRSSDVLLSTIEELEKVKKENTKLKKQLSIAFYTLEILAEDEEEYIKSEAKHALKRIKRVRS